MDAGSPGEGTASANLPWLAAGAEPWSLTDQAHVFAALYYAVPKPARAVWDSEGPEAHRAAAEVAVFDAVCRSIPEQCAEVIVLGGDDLRLFVPGRRAWSVANTIAPNAEDAFRNQSTGQPALTLSVGVVITHPQTPITLQNVAVGNFLLQWAKEHAKRDPRSPQSAIDISVLDSFQHFASDVKPIETQLSAKGRAKRR